ncbi:MAG TPA: (2Fe-2S)-binding protein [Acidimicrobiales bacterium]|jgi:carbon-monoxide dehydrogenase small subunit|nr:(2Fe-2S)-binding protein [Acidimicrobiales bacterium]
MNAPVELVVNARPVRVEVEPRTTLLDFLRDELGLTGAHAGCEQGACGACNVLLDGRVVRSCLVLAAGASGSDVTTVEHLGTPDLLHPVQEALWRHHGLQCGYCTPGIVIAAVDLLSRIPSPTDAQVREALNGNLCRCTGYAGMVAAIVEAGGSHDDEPVIG